MVDAVADGAWRIAMRATGHRHLAEELVDRGCRAFRAERGAPLVRLLACVLDAANEYRRSNAGGSYVAADRRGPSWVRDAFELVHVGGASMDDVARMFGCTTRELAREFIDMVAGPRPAPA